MKSKQLIKLITSSLFIIFIGIVFSSCEAGKEFANSSSKLSKKNHSITFEQFKNETNQQDFKTKIKIKSSVKRTSSRNADGTYELSDFDIDTELIKKLDLNEKSTYSFRIYPTIAVTPDSFYNLTMYKKGDNWVQSIIEFKPTDENLDKILSGQTEKVDGKMSLIYTTNIDSLNTNNICYKVQIINSHCNNLGTCTKESCDGCYGANGQGCVDKQYSSFCFNGNSITIGEQKDIIDQSIDDTDDPNNIDIKNSFFLNVNQIKDNTIGYVKKNIDVSNQIIDLLSTETNLNFSTIPPSVTNLEELRAAFIDAGVTKVDDLINLLTIRNKIAIDFNNNNKDFAILKQSTKEELIDDTFNSVYVDNSGSTDKICCYCQWVRHNGACTRAFIRNGTGGCYRCS